MANDQEKEQEQQEQQELQDQQNIAKDSIDTENFITETEDKDLKKQREAEEEKAREQARKRKLIPPFVMLLAGAIVSITLRSMHYELKDMLIILLCVLLGFYFAGCVIEYMLNQFEKQIEKERMEEEGIEKDPEAEDDTENVRGGTDADTEENEPEQSDDEA